MTHATGNATWADYPVTNIITAAKLEGVENSTDALYVSEYGTTSRTAHPVFVARLTTGSIALAAGTDVIISSGFTVAKDTESAWVVPGGTTPSYYQIPMSGRVWDLYFRASIPTAPNPGGVAAKILLNGTGVTTNTIASDAKASLGAELYPTAWRSGLSGLVAGDKLYFGAYATAACGIGIVFGFVYPTIMIRDAGPA